MGKSATQNEDPCARYQEIEATMGGNAFKIRLLKDHEPEVEGNTGCFCRYGGPPMPPPEFQTNTPGTTKPGTSSGNPFEFKMGGCGVGAGKGGNIVVVPPASTAQEAPAYEDIADPGKDLYILRILKKSQAANKKNNMEMELCSPMLKRPPTCEHRKTQYNPVDAGVPPKVTKKKKEKKKKKKKKK